MTILDEIFAHKREEVAGQKQVRPLAVVQAEAERAAPPRDLVAALRGSPARPALIAEIKRASPSRGLLVPHFDPLHLARVYQQNDAAAISVLTDRRFFQGDLDILRAVRQAVDLPVLRKDFVFDPYQVYAARAAGAGAILLIVAMLSDEELPTLYQLTRKLGMAALVEVHDEAEMERALAIGPHLVGINNRDLRTFKVDIETTARLRPLVPADITLVAESGIHTPGDVARLAAIGVDAMLVGESLVVAEDTAAKVRELTHHAKQPNIARTTPHVKICGITNLNDALAAVEAGADILGFNFYEPSPRYVCPADCARLVAALQNRGASVTMVGVFVNSPLQEVASILNNCGLDLAQLHGDEPPVFLEALDGQAFKAIRPPTLAAAQIEARRYACRAAPPALLVDAFRSGQYGGTGQIGDWTLAGALAAEYPLLLAGGLRPENVATAVAQVRPWGVDAASGVEASPGRKDADKMKAFVSAVNAVTADE
jgi:indole-3-glycerol phosphate synthase/phosphoribosylanthranilate isomerase